MTNYNQYIYSTGTHYISNNGHDENNGYSGGKAGDQTGDEWCLRSWYNRPWSCVLRYPDDNVALKLAELGCAAALNDLIGYDQNERDTYWTQLKKAGYDPSTITTACEADCSAGVIANTRAVGYIMGIQALKNLSATYTGDMRAGFKYAGFEVLTADKYLSGYTYLKPGDILLNDSHHTCTNITLGANATFNPSSDTGSTSEPATRSAEPEVIWNYLLAKIGNKYGTAGLMGNLYAESAYLSCNLQDSFEKKLGYTDESYTDAVDDGSYTDFVSDSAGYGLAQWTYKTRKQALLSYCNAVGASIGNLNAQLAYLYTELCGDFVNVLTKLQNATSVKEASDLVLTKFEMPADQSDTMKNLRFTYAQQAYDTYAGTTSSEPVTDDGGIDYAESLDTSGKGGVRFTVTTNLFLRTGAGKDKDIIKVLLEGEKITWYGYYTAVSGIPWYLIQDSTGQTGFCSSKYLKKA